MTLFEAKKSDFSFVKHLYRRAFPAEERAPFFLLRRRALQKRGTLWIAKADERYIGFAYVVCGHRLAYLAYFAVDDRQRGSGNGSRILAQLKDIYADRTLFLAREQLDPSADNYSQRLRRHTFYRRNGFCDLPCHIREGSVVYDVMSSGAEISVADYDALIDGWIGKTWRSLIRMRLYS